MRQECVNAFTLWLSGAAKMKNNKEIWWKNNSGEDITIEFPENSLSYVIFRSYDTDGLLRWIQKCYYSEDGVFIDLFHKEIISSNSIAYTDRYGDIISKAEYENGVKSK